MLGTSIISSSPNSAHLSVPQPSSRRWWYVVPQQGGNSTGFNYVGTALTGGGGNGTTAAVQASSTDPACINIATNTSGDDWYFVGSSATAPTSSNAFLYIGRTNQKIRFQLSMRLLSVPSTNWQIHFGLTDTLRGSSLNPGANTGKFQDKIQGNFIGFWCPGGASGFTAGWNSVTQTSPSSQTVNRFSAGDIHWHTLEFDVDFTAGTVTFYYDGTLVETHSTNIPSGVYMQWLLMVTNDVTGGGGFNGVLNCGSIYGEEAYPMNL